MARKPKVAAPVLHTAPIQSRQGDVLLHPFDGALPKGCKPVHPDKTDDGLGRIVLAYGEVTGHAHAIYDHVDKAPDAKAIAGAAIAIAKAKAQLFVAPNGERYLEVTEPVTLRHEEHTVHALVPGIYRLPKQMEYDPPEYTVRGVMDLSESLMRRVAD